MHFHQPRGKTRIQCQIWNSHMGADRLFAAVYTKVEQFVVFWLVAELKARTVPLSSLAANLDLRHLTPHFNPRHCVLPALTSYQQQRVDSSEVFTIIVLAS